MRTGNSPTSTTTIENENISVFLLGMASPREISGAVHLGVWSSQSKAPAAVLGSWAIFARPKSVIRAFPDAPTRTLDWAHSDQNVTQD